MSHEISFFRLNVFMFIKAKKRNRKNRDKSIGNAWFAAVQIGGEGAVAKQAAEPMGYLNYSESALLNSNRLSEGAKRMSLPVYRLANSESVARSAQICTPSRALY